MMRKTNPSISDDEVSKIISEVDLDGDGTINFDGRSYLVLFREPVRAETLRICHRIHHHDDGTAIQVPRDSCPCCR